MFGSANSKLRNKNLELYRDITDDVEESDFVPYACFYDAHTVITKNGELCQTIKMTGLNRDTVNSETDAKELRGLIRESLKRHVPNDSFAIWLHTLRKETDLSPSGEFKTEGFAKNLNEAWVNENNFANQFVNEVFITIVHEGQDARLREVKNFVRGLIPSSDLKWRNEYIDSIFNVLNGTVENILGDLKDYGAKRLGMHKKNGIYYSEQLRFLEKIINFVDRPMPVTEIDLCTYLTSGEITFAFNAMEVRTASGKRRFASILTLKEYKEASLTAIDQFLQLPMEFIVTQTINFVNPNKVLFEYQEIANYQSLSEDEDITRISELSNILQSNRNNPNDFGEQQLTIFILSDTVQELEQNVKRTIKFFSKYGMIAVREDIKFQETYWAQLPGNFVFVSRMKPTNTSHVAGFANLNNLPVGRDRENHWGPAVTTFHTASGTPYYFNFHVGNVGHTSIVGPRGSGKSVLTNFLLSQSIKLSPKIYYLDVSYNCTSLTHYLGGQYCDISPDDTPDTPESLFNPFSCNDTLENRKFLARWMGVLGRAGGYALSDQDKQAISNAIHNTYAHDPSTRNFLTCIGFLRALAPDYVAAIAQWLPEGIYGHVFTAQHDIFSNNAPMYGINMQQAMQDAGLAAALTSFVLQKLLDTLDGSPTIIVLDEGWRLLSQTHISADISGWLNQLTQKNTMIVTVAEDINDSDANHVAQQLVAQCVTQIYMPNDNPCAQYQSVFGLDDLEFSYLDIMEKHERHFLLKHGGETIIGEMNLHGLEQYVDILAGADSS